MKNTKKLIFAGSLVLALSAGLVLPQEVKAEGENTPASVEKVDDTVELRYNLRIRNEDGSLTNIPEKMYENLVVSVNGVDQSFNPASVVDYEAKRGTTVTFKVKPTSERGSKYIYEGVFDVPEVGYKNYNNVTVEMYKINEEGEANPEKPNDGKKNDGSEVNPQNPSDDKKDDNTEVNPQNPQDGKTEDKIEENPQDGKTEDKTEENNDGKNEGKTEASTDETKDEKNEDKTSIDSNDKNEDKNKPLTAADLTDKGFATREEAEDAAKKVLENDKINKSYSISKGKDGKYYVALSPVEAVEEDKENKEKDHNKATQRVQSTEDDHNKDDRKVRRVENENEVKKVNNPTNRSHNVRTGVGSIAGIGGVLGLSLAGILATKKKNK